MDTQQVLRIKNNRRVVRQHIPVEGEAVIVRPEMMGWLRFREFVGKVEGIKRLGLFIDNSRYMVVDDRDGYPVSPYRPSKDFMEKQCTAEGDDEMADRQGNYQLSRHQGEARRTLFSNSIAIAIMGIVAMAGILLIVYLVKT